MTKSSAILILLILLPAVSLSSGKLNGNGQKPNADKKVFKSLLGYQIEYPKCMTIVPSYADDSDEKPEDVEDVMVTPGDSNCRFSAQGPGVSVKLSHTLDKTLSFQERIKKVENGIELNKRGGNSSNLYFKSKGDSFVQITTLSPTDVRWESYIPCGKDYFVVEFSSHNDDKDGSKLISAIKVGNLSWPEREKKVLDSFKCLKK